MVMQFCLICDTGFWFLTIFHEILLYSNPHTFYPLSMYFRIITANGGNRYHCHNHARTTNIRTFKHNKKQIVCIVKIQGKSVQKCFCTNNVSILVRFSDIKHVFAIKSFGCNIIRNH